MGAVLQKLGFGGDEGGGDAAVKRQAEGLSNPMYQLANLMGQVRWHFERDFVVLCRIWSYFPTTLDF